MADLYFTCQSCGKILIRGHNPEKCSDCGGEMKRGIEKLFSQLTYDEKQQRAAAQREWDNIKLKKSYRLEGTKK